MFNKIKSMIGMSEEYMEWDEYKARKDFIEDFVWQQNCRKQHLPKEDMED